MGYDPRIGKQFLDAGWDSGVCFPKDVKALAPMASVQGKHPQLLQAVMDINADQRKLVVNKLRELLGELDDKVVGLLGLAFKPNTDDMRDAPSRCSRSAIAGAGEGRARWPPCRLFNVRWRPANCRGCTRW